MAEAGNMIDFDNPDFSKARLETVTEELKNFGKTLVSAEDVIRKAQAGESLAGHGFGTWTFPARICAGKAATDFVAENQIGWSKPRERKFARSVLR